MNQVVRSNTDANRLRCAFIRTFAISSDQQYDAIDVWKTYKYRTVRHSMIQSSINIHTYNYKKTDKAQHLYHVITDVGRVHVAIGGHLFTPKPEPGIQLFFKAKNPNFPEYGPSSLPGSPPSDSHLVERAFGRGNPPLFQPLNPNTKHFRIMYLGNAPPANSGPPVGDDT